MASAGGRRKRSSSSELVKRELLDEVRDNRAAEKASFAKVDISKMTLLCPDDPLLNPRDIPSAASKAKLAIAATRKQAAHHSLVMQLGGWVEHPCRMGVVSGGDGKDVVLTWSAVYFRRAPGKRRALIVFPILYAHPKATEDVVDSRAAKEWLAKAAPDARAVSDSDIRDLAWIASLELQIKPELFHRCDAPSDELWDFTDPVRHPSEHVFYRWLCDYGQT